MTHTVMIVDDDPLSRTLIEELLKEHLPIHVRLLYARDGIAAQYMMQRVDINVVISDVNMPDCCGITLAEYCARRHPNTDFVLMSSDEPLGWRWIPNVKYFLLKGDDVFNNIALLTDTLLTIQANAD